MAMEDSVFFNKVYKYLKKGGLFILEPQPWEGYKKRAGMAPHMRDNYMEMQFYPKDFLKFLTNKVGFRLIDTIEPKHPSKALLDRSTYCKSEGHEAHSNSFLDPMKIIARALKNNLIKNKLKIYSF